MSGTGTGVRIGTPTGRAVIAAAVLGSGIAQLDGTVVNVALRTIGASLGASLQQLQWVTNGYLLSLASLILLGGSLGDRFGRRRVFVVGVVWFAVASLLCGLAPTPGILIGARVLQGVGGALLTPGSLAMIQGAFAPGERAAAIGAWTGLSSIAGAIGPFLGGGLVQYVDWRWIFLINAPLAVLTVLIAVHWVPETRDPHAPARLDVGGAALATVALAATTYALVEAGDDLGWAALVVGGLAAAGFVVVEARGRQPMVQLSVFADRTFSAANVVTLVVYGALGAVLFFLTLQLQTVSGYGALAAGASFVPMTILMLLLAGQGGRLAQRIGPRLPMTLGPLVLAAGVALMARVGPHADYLRDVLPAVLVFGAGAVLLVAPLTATVLAAAPDEQAGVASGVNNAVARAGSLLAVAALPVAVGLRGEQYRDPVALDSAFGSVIRICVVLLLLGAVVSWALIRNQVLDDAPATQVAP